MIQFTAADFGQRFDELAGTDEASVQAKLQAARSYVDEATFGADAREALMLYTAHLVAQADASRRAGAQVVEERVGDVNRKFATDPANAEIGGTGYKDQFSALCRKVSAGGFFAAGSC